MVVKDLYIFQTIKALETLDRIVDPTISLKLRRQQRFSFSIHVTTQARLYSVMRFLHEEKMVYFAGMEVDDNEREPPSVVSVRAVPLPRLARTLPSL